MYWIYLTLFVLAVFVPDFVRHDFYFLTEERVEELFIFVIGAAAFLLYLWKEKQLLMKTKERVKIQREVSLTSRDLTDTYSYIGEINRKIEILKDIALGLNEKETITESREMELYKSIIHAIQMFTKSKQVSLHFINMKNGKILKEIKDSRNRTHKPINPAMIKNEMSFYENDNCFFSRAPKTLKNVNVCIVIEKRNASQKMEDPDLVKALASQALFLFNFANSSRMSSQRTKH